MAWCVLAVVIGLLQLWCLLGFVALDQNSTVETGRLLRDCGLLFFSSTLVATFGLDFAFSARTSRTLLIHWLVYCIFPGIVVCASILVYSVCYLGHPKFPAILLTQLTVTFAAFVYAVAIKFQHFRNRF